MKWQANLLDIIRQIISGRYEIDVSIKYRSIWMINHSKNSPPLSISISLTPTHVRKTYIWSLFFLSGSPTKIFHRTIVNRLQPQSFTQHLKKLKNCQNFNIVKTSNCQNFNQWGAIEVWRKCCFFDAPQSMSHIFQTSLVQIIVLGLLHVSS